LHQNLYLRLKSTSSLKASLMFWWFSIDKCTGNVCYSFLSPSMHKTYCLS
jgi:hypothetical protein